MKILVAVALFATSLPTIALAEGRPATASEDRRVCTQASAARAGSRMGPRRICRTAAQWRESLGPDWRQHLAGATGTQDDYDAVQARSVAYDGSGGIRPDADSPGQKVISPN
jgi:hypothetical protein